MNYRQRSNSIQIYIIVATTLDLTSSEQTAIIHHLHELLLQYFEKWASRCLPTIDTYIFELIPLSFENFSQNSSNIFNILGITQAHDNRPFSYQMTKSTFREIRKSYLSPSLC